MICGLSGGVDSAVAALLVHKAVGDAAHVRLRRPRAPAQGRGRAGRGDVRATTSACRSSTVDARERFLARLAGVADPEEKRKAIGQEFIEVFEEEARALGDVALPRPGDALLRT